MAPNIQPVIAGAVHKTLPSVRIEGIDIVPGHDHNDEEALFVAIEVPPGTERLGGEKFLEVAAGVNDALLGAGDLRFAYVHVRYRGDEDAEEDEPARASGP